MTIVSETKAQIVRALKDGPLHGYAIYVRTEVPIGSIYDHLRELEKAGFVKSERSGRRKVYRLTKRGEMLLKALGL